MPGQHNNPDHSSNILSGSTVNHQSQLNLLGIEQLWVASILEKNSGKMKHNRLQSKRKLLSWATGNRAQPQCKACLINFVADLVCWNLIQLDRCTDFFDLEQKWILKGKQLCRFQDQVISDFAKHPFWHRHPPLRHKEFWMLHRLSAVQLVPVLAWQLDVDAKTSCLESTSAAAAAASQNQMWYGKSPWSSMIRVSCAQLFPVNNWTTISQPGPIEFRSQSQDTKKSSGLKDIVRLNISANSTSAWPYPTWPRLQQETTSHISEECLALHPALVVGGQMAEVSIPENRHVTMPTMASRTLERRTFALC